MADDMKDTAGGQPQMRQLPSVSIEGPIPSAIADLISLMNDLTFVQQTCNQLAKMGSLENDQDEGDSIVRRALWASAVIAYRRAFNSGKAHLVAKGSRAKVSGSLVDELDPQLRAVHDLALSTANKHVAHRASDLEGILISLVLSLPPDPPGVIGVGQLTVQYVGPEAEQVLALAKIAAQFVSALAVEYELRTSQLAAQANRGDIPALYASATTGPP